MNEKLPRVRSEDVHNIPVFLKHCLPKLAEDLLGCLSFITLIMEGFCIRCYFLDFGSEGVKRFGHAI